MKKFYAGCALAVLATSNLHAQSTGSVEFENKDIVVTGSKVRSVGGVTVPDTTKSKAVLTDRFIQQQVPGQSINDVINQLPGVSFQNNDPFGSAGGRLNIRGFDQSRISETFDGIPLNDTGSYDIFSNQQLDPELIDQVSVNLGSTDVDSPTASATGSTVNYRTRNPTTDFHVRLQGSVGNFGYTRFLGILDTGEVGPIGTRAWFEASKADNRAIFGNYGRINKQQFNAKIYQPIGGNGDFVSIAGHYNGNRNNFFGSVPFRTDTDGGRVAGSTTGGNRFPLTKDERYYNVPACTRQAGVRGTQQTDTTTANSLVQTAANCGSIFDYRTNPSNTGNIRVNSRFTLADKLVLTVDPSFQYTSANGGGLATANERTLNVGTAATGIIASTGYVGSTPYVGRDLNGDGDLLDLVNVAAPSQTRTHRYGVIASLRYDFNADHSVRVNYSLDYGRHRQTGEIQTIDANGTDPYYTLSNSIVGARGNRLEKRDRLSYAILNQASGEYRGRFFDKLTVNLGVRAPFFKRDLNNYCFTTSASGTVTCFENDNPSNVAYAAQNPYTVSATGVPSGAQTPQQRVFKYHRVLPNAGFTFDLTPQASLYANYSKSLQVPGTDNLYTSFYYPQGTSQASPRPETADNFDAGIRYRSSVIQAQLTGWYTRFHNRLASAFDRDLNVTIYRNLGTVDKYGIDGSIAYQPVPDITLYTFGSYLKSKIKNNVDAGATCTAANVTAGALGCTAVGQVAFFQTAGRRESGAPVYMFGGRVEGTLGPVQIGIQAKRTGPRYYNDQNLPVFAAPLGGTALIQVFGAKIPAYTLVDLEARFSLEKFGLNDRTYFQLNVTNLFDKLYYGGFAGGTTSNTTVLTGQIGAPRAVVGTLVVGF